MELLIVNIYLLWGTWQDIRRKKVKNWYLGTGGLLGIIFQGICAISGTFSFKSWILAMVPGVLFLTIAKLTKEKIGCGDGWVILILGNFLNVSGIWYLCQMAFVLVMIFSFVLLCSKRVSKKYQIPFLPFLWAASLLLWRFHYG